MKLTKYPMNFLPSRKGVCLAGLLGLVVASPAQTFNYNNGDLLIGVRTTAGSTYDLVVNAGPVSAFTNLTVGTKITISSLTGTQLQAAFSETNNLSWAAFACIDSGTDENTLFMSRARMNLEAQSSPWRRYTLDSQGSVVAKINGVGIGAYSLGLAQAAGPNNTTTAIVEPESANVAPNYSYRAMLGNLLNWGGTFQGSPEQDTAANFTTASVPARSDFYWLPPGGTASTHPAAAYLGYFDFNTNGVLTYTAGPSAAVVVAAQIVSITRVGHQASIQFTTGAAGTYTLRAASDLTVPRTSWVTLGSVSGDGLTHSLSETTTADLRYYSISAQ
jgi:hypothetical protein